MRIRSTLKRSVELAAVHTGLGPVGRFLRRRDILILAYHNVVPDTITGIGDLSLHTHEREFRRQIAALLRTHDVVAISSILEDSPRRSPMRPRVVITFDDAYVGAVTIGARVLADFGVPATIFVAPGLLGTFAWWDLLASQFERVGPPFRDRCLIEFRGEAESILAHFGAHAHQPSVDVLRIASESELGSVAAQAGITLGSHTWSHPNLGALDRPRVDAEIQQSVDWLQSRYLSVVPWLAYPYGLHGVVVEEAAGAAGLAGALRVDGGWSGSSPAPRFAVPRMNVPAGISLEGFLLCVNGIRPL